MTVKLTLSPELQSRVEAQAAAQGLPVSTWLVEVIEQAAPPATAFGARTLELFAAWDKEDATNDAAELSRRRQDFEEFQAWMNRHRAGERRLYT